MHLSGNTNCRWENHNLVIGEIKLLCKRCVIRGALICARLGIEISDCEQFSTRWVLEKEREFFEANEAMTVLLEFGDQLPVGLHLHDVLRKVYDFEYLLLLGPRDHLLREIIYIQVKEVGEDFHQIVVILVPAWDVLASYHATFEGLLTCLTRVGLSIGAI